MERPLRLLAEETPQARLRRQWSERLREQMATLDVSQKQLRQVLHDAGCAVSRQTVNMWVNGTTAPAPHHQVAIAKALSTTTRALFPVEDSVA